MKRKKKSGFLRYISRFLLWVLKSPYYFVKWVYNLGKRISRRKKEVEISRKRKAIVAKYQDFKILKSISGNYEKWLFDVVRSDSKIGIILGARGSGKTAFGIKFLENFYARHKKKCFAIGFNAQELPSWIEVISDIDKIKNDSLVLIDEGGVLFNSRSSMSSANKMLSQLIMIARHKNISILFISQNSSNLEVNILRQADFLILKPSSLLQKDFERKIVQKIYEGVEKDFEKFESEKGVTYIYSGKFRGFVANSLPSFWKVGISKSFSSKK